MLLELISVTLVASTSNVLAYSHVEHAVSQKAAPRISSAGSQWPWGFKKKCGNVWVALQVFD